MVYEYLKGASKLIINTRKPKSLRVITSQLGKFFLAGVVKDKFLPLDVINLILDF